MQIAAQHSGAGFLEAMGSTYPYDGLANHPLGVGFPKNNLKVNEFLRQQMLAPSTQGAEMKKLQDNIDSYAKRHVPLLLTAYGHVQSNIPSSADQSFHLNLMEGLLTAGELIQYQNIGITLAHKFLLNDTSFNPDPDDAPTLRRYNAAIISNGTDSHFVATPSGLALGIMSKLGGKTQIGSTVINNPQIQLENGASSPTLDTLSTIATKDASGNLDVVVINQSIDSDLTANVVLDTSSVYNPTAKVSTLNGASPLSMNTLTEPGNVQVTTKDVGVGQNNFNYTFPAHSITRIEIKAYNPQIIVTPSQTSRSVEPELFGAIPSFQDNGQGAIDYTKADSVTGIKAFYPEYVSILKKLNIKQLRWGDASPTGSIFEWKRSIGPQSSRTMQRSREGSPGIPATYGPDEFGQLVEAIGATGNWVYNSERGNVQDASNLLAYLTVPVSSNPSSNPKDPSYWAALRAANGHPLPYPINYFDIGNEIGGVGANSSKTYWRKGSTVTIGAHTTPTEGVPDEDLLYAFGGTTAFTKQAVVGYADMQASAANSTGEANQEFYASYPPIVPQSQTVYVGSSAWSKVEDLSATNASSEVYTIDNQTGKIVFGDGIHGKIPPKDMQITISYQSGPHEGFVDYYAALKKVNPNVKIIAQDSHDGFIKAMGTAYSYDGLSNHPLGVGFPSTSLSADEFNKQLMLAPVTQGVEAVALQQQIDNVAGKHIPLLLTAYGHSQGNQPSGDTENHLRLMEALVSVNELIQFQNAGIPLAHKFLLNDKPYNPNPNEAPPARRYNAMIVSNGKDPNFYVSPPGLAIGLMANLAGKTQVNATIADNPPISLAAGAKVSALNVDGTVSSVAATSIPTLTTIAAKDSKGNLSLMVTNQSTTADQTAQVVTTNFSHHYIAKITTLNGATPQSLNTFADPNAVALQTNNVNVGTDTFSYSFPAHSITMIELQALNASITSVSRSSFDKRIPGDITVSFSTYGNQLTSISNAVRQLRNDEYYSVSSSVYSAVYGIKSSYFSNQPLGTDILTFHFNKGDDVSTSFNIFMTSSGSGSTSSGGSSSSGSSSSSGTTNTSGSPISADTASGKATVDIVSTLVPGTAIAKSAIQNELLTQAFTVAQTDDRGVKTVTFRIPKVECAQSYEASLPPAALTQDAGLQKIELNTDVARLTVPGNMLKTADFANISDVSLTMERVNRASLSDAVKSTIGDHPVIELNMKINGSNINWSNPKAPVSVAIPYQPSVQELSNPEQIVVYYIDGSGSLNVVSNGKYNPITGEVTFVTTHFSKYAVGFVNKSFADLANMAWAKKEIEVLAAKGIVNGTSDSTFSPESNISRADFLMLLVKTLDLNVAVTDNFTDTKPGDYYYEALGIAKKLGIAEGKSNNHFEPKASISRQEMITLTWRAMKLANKAGTNENLSALAPFTDRDDIAPYAVDSIAALVKENMIRGNGTILNPLGNTTRAEAAVLMYRLYNK